MARPGLEPGTPRFSGSRCTAGLIAKDLQMGLVSTVRRRRDTVGFVWFGARLGLHGGPGVPNEPWRTRDVMAPVICRQPWTASRGDRATSRPLVVCVADATVRIISGGGACAIPGSQTSDVRRIEGAPGLRAMAAMALGQTLVRMSGRAHFPRAVVLRRVDRLRRRSVLGATRTTRRRGSSVGCRRRSSRAG